MKEQLSDFPPLPSEAVPLYAGIMTGTSFAATAVLADFKMAAAVCLPVPRFRLPCLIFATLSPSGAFSAAAAAFPSGHFQNTRRRDGDVARLVCPTWSVLLKKPTISR